MLTLEDCKKTNVERRDRVVVFLKISFGILNFFYLFFFFLETNIKQIAILANSGRKMFQKQCSI